jgi:hypothetical protein
MFFRPVIEECRADSGVEPVQVDTKLVSEPLEVFLRRKAAPVYPFSNIITADEDNFIGIDTSIPCGLIINELLSNSLKHAFPEKRKGEIDIKIHRTGDSEIEMIFRDNGIGLPEEYDFRDSPGFGFRMIIDLVEYKLMGRINLVRGKSSASALAEASTVPAYRQAGGGEGTQFQILFKEIKYKKRI